MQLQVSDRDQPNKPNSKIAVRLVSQTPDEPKIALEQLNGRLVQLTFSGCFDYDVSRTCQFAYTQNYKKTKTKQQLYRVIPKISLICFREKRSMKLFLKPEITETQSFPPLL